MKIAIAQINPTVGALEENAQKIIRALKIDADLVLFPEMALTGYPPQDLLLMPAFVQAATEALEMIIPHTKGKIAVIGTIRPNPTPGQKPLFNTAAILEEGKFVGFQDKTLLPEYNVFNERRYFEPAHHTDVWSLKGKKVAITICEDLWQLPEYTRNPVVELVDKRPDLVLNLSASPYHTGRFTDRLEVCQKAAKMLGCPLYLCNQVGGNDSLIFDGYSLHLDKRGELVGYGKGFEEDLALQGELIEPIEELFHALVLGVRDYFHKQGFEKACFGLSGGIDSAVVACIAKHALGAENVLALLLPSRYSTEAGKHEALELVKTLGIGHEEISIEGPFSCFLETLEPHFAGKEPDVTEENLQARIRGILLMAFSNKFGYLLLGTGNKSEMAMGYMTLYGDMCGGLGVLSDVTKGQVYALARWLKTIPQTTIDKPPSAELAPNQFDHDSLPEYAVIDQVVTAYVEDHLSIDEIVHKHNLPLALVKQLVGKIHSSEYKRQQAPPGLRVTRRAFTVGRHFPIVQKWDTNS